MKKNFCSLGHIQLAFGFTLLVSGLAIGQIRNVKGIVTENLNNKPLSGVSVFQEGSDVVTMSSSSGVYNVQVSGENPVLVFRHPDYPDRKIPIGNRVSVDVSLDKDNGKEKQIEEVILNAGYYKVAERESTGSISRITAKEIENQPVNNVLQSAQGRMAGVSITQNSGVPGGGYDIQIRGRNSLRNKNNSEIDGNQPLYVIDGIPFGSEMSSQYSASVLPGRSINPLNSINPDDIEKMEILKDADATAIYGSRGANGVMLVTTKKGRSGKVGLNFNTSYGFSSIISNLKLMDTEQYLSMRKQAFANNNITAYPATAYDVNGTWDQSRHTDWPKSLLGNLASFSNTQLSVNGGSETTSFLLSMGHSEQTTVFEKDFKYKSSNLSSQISHRSKDQKFNLNISNTFSIQNNDVVRADLTRQAYNLAPNAPALYNGDGSLNWQNNTFNNPVASFNATYGNENKQFLNSINLQYSLFKDFSIKLNGGLNYQIFEELSLQPNTMYNPAFASGQSSATSRASKSDQSRLSFIIEPQANWSHTFGNHQIDVLAGGTFQRETSDQNSLTGIGFESNIFIENIGAAKTKIIGDELSTEYRYAALFGRFNYQFKKRYILNVTGRRDGSSRFGTNKKFANFGAVGAAWLFSEEQFLKESSWLSFGKVRGSFGTAGSDNIGDYQYIDTYTVSSTNPYNNVNGLIPSRLYNPDYSWEKTTKLEAAIELGLFRNRVNLTTAWYRNRSTNQLIGYQLPSVAGFTSVLSNLNAEVENTGLEIELSGKPLNGKLKWETGVNLTFPKNRLISFPGLEGSTYANQFMIGYSTSIIKLYQLEGLNSQTGAYVFTDYNGDGKISSPQDNRVVEDLTVKYFGGWNNSLTFQNWNLSFLFQFVNQKNRNYNNAMPVPGSMNNQPIQVLDVWSPGNPNGSYMPYTSLSNPLHSLFQSSTASVSDASYIRLKNVQLSYAIPLKDSAFKSIRIYFQGQNLLTFTKYFGVDPEFSAMGFLPPLKTCSFGLQLSL
ncbi:MULTISPECIES: SusC/RagA family TonB-linked outer membrane protein [Chryseobacterium]|uniref:SusC/RagA family TonB-linked outer membrane protein n=2 Tax=Chryseobacterium TaxID=59732 RepID=A0A101CHD3_9FLAO|nr:MULTISPECIES: SusC/RagA family TonB-linked outer membrane protein [Chryseobacterium]KUJ56240.1 SusC/RagA family TonB-linked outer membrane protein [Chryseobacterium aquaticum subsp. greenlandense]QQV01824.1 SusC/RagA family TonB-linked outer membrane protein [Chryseobacterium sp. FDAARGOS 1104]VFB04963.1 Outer membrane receptor for ferrienterochelin and colicins [Chryseobacterium taihuense]